MFCPLLTFVEEISPTERTEMYALLLKSSAAVLLTIALAAGSAAAQVDVEMAFDPSTVNAGDAVNFFSSISHLGSEATDANVEFSFAFGEFEFGPMQGSIPLAAGLERSSEFSFVAPPLPMTYTMTITLSVTAGESTDTTTATLTILAAEGDSLPFASKDVPTSLRSLGEQLAGSVLDQTTAVQEDSFGAVKERYRR